MCACFRGNTKDTSEPLVGIGACSYSRACIICRTGGALPPAAPAVPGSPQFQGYLGFALDTDIGVAHRVVLAHVEHVVARIFPVDAIGTS